MARLKRRGHQQVGSFGGRASASTAERAPAARARLAAHKPSPAPRPRSVGVKPTSVMTNAFQLISKVGGVVFTNGELDPYMGGSPTSQKDLKASPKSPAGVDYVTYAGVSHTNDFKWYQPFEAAGNKALRARAIGKAVEFAQAWRRAHMA